MIGQRTLIKNNIAGGGMQMGRPGVSPQTDFFRQFWPDGAELEPVDLEFRLFTETSACILQRS